LLTLALATVPLPLATLQLWPAGEVLTVTAYAVPLGWLPGKV